MLTVLKAILISYLALRVLLFLYDIFGSHSE